MGLPKGGVFPLLAPQAAWFQLVYIPAERMSMQEAIGRGVMMMMALQKFEVSVVLEQPAEDGPVLAAAQVAKDKMKDLMPLLDVQKKAMSRGQPVTKKLAVGVKDEPEDVGEQQTKKEIAEGKQQVLVSLPGVTGGRAMQLNRPDTAASSRASQASVAEAAKKKEKKTQKDANKRNREKQEKAIAEAKSKSKPAKPPKKKAGKKAPKLAEVPDAQKEESSSSSEDSSTSSSE